MKSEQWMQFQGQRQMPGKWKPWVPTGSTGKMKTGRGVQPSEVTWSVY